jgi:arylformamidase
MVQLFDLSQPLGPDLTVQPGDPPLTLLRTSSHEVHGYEVTQVCLGSHTGTHMDAPRHFYPQGPTVDQYSLDRLVGPAVILDCRPTGDMTAGDIVSEQLRRFPLRPGGLVLLWTEGATVTVEAVDILVGAGARLVATDAPSLDEEPYPVHRYLLARDVLIVENLCGLERLGPGPVDCAFLPLALVGTDGAPVRAVAWRTTEREPG